MANPKPGETFLFSFTNLLCQDQIKSYVICLYLTGTRAHSVELDQHLFSSGLGISEFRGSWTLSKFRHDI